MKLFTLDLSWAGGLVAIANSKEEAIKFWKDTYHSPKLNQETLDKIEEYPIESGTSVCFMGDS